MYGKVARLYYMYKQPAFFQSISFLMKSSSMTKGRGIGKKKMKKKRGKKTKRHRNSPRSKKRVYQERKKSVSELAKEFDERQKVVQLKTELEAKVGPEVVSTVSTQEFVNPAIYLKKQYFISDGQIIDLPGFEFNICADCGSYAKLPKKSRRGRCSRETCLASDSVSGFEVIRLFKEKTGKCPGCGLHYIVPEYGDIDQLHFCSSMCVKLYKKERGKTEFKPVQAIMCHANIFYPLESKYLDTLLPSKKKCDCGGMYFADSEEGVCLRASTCWYLHKAPDIPGNQLAFRNPIDIGECLVCGDTFFKTSTYGLWDGCCGKRCYVNLS